MGKFNLSNIFQSDRKKIRQKTSVRKFHKIVLDMLRGIFENYSSRNGAQHQNISRIPMSIFGCYANTKCTFLNYGNLIHHI